MCFLCVDSILSLQARKQYLWVTRGFVKTPGFRPSLNLCIRILAKEIAALASGHAARSPKVFSKREEINRFGNCSTTARVTIENFWRIYEHSHMPKINSSSVKICESSRPRLAQKFSIVTRAVP